MCDTQHDSDSSRMDADTACWRGSLRRASRSRRRYYARCTRPPSLTAISLLYTCSRSAQLRKSGGGDGAGVGGERGGGATRQRPLRVEPGSPARFSHHLCRPLPHPLAILRRRARLTSGRASVGGGRPDLALPAVAHGWVPRRGRRASGRRTGRARRPAGGCGGPGGDGRCQVPHPRSDVSCLLLVGK